MVAVLNPGDELLGWFPRVHRCCRRHGGAGTVSPGRHAGRRF